MKILCLGDIVGPDGVSCIAGRLAAIRREKNIALVIANAENADEGNGLSRDTAALLFERGADVITSGNHIWKKSALHSFLDDCDTLIRPLNYPGECPGKGWCLIDVDGCRGLVMNVQGTVFMEPLDSPFNAVEKALAMNEGKYDFSVLDIHAEATSEKLALAHCFDGKITIVFGTHTHVPTADIGILPHGTAYITDLGMCGVQSGILGVEPDVIIGKLRSHMPARFTLAKGTPVASGALFEIDPFSGKVMSAERIEF